VRSRLATAYTIGRRGPRPLDDYDFTTGGASCAFSTTRDMARYLAALMGGGANEHGRVLRPETLRSMYEPHYQPDPRVPGFGLGFFRAGSGEHLIVEHGGIAPGFVSQFFLAPEERVGVMAFTNGARNALLWLPGELGTMLDSLVDVGPLPPVPDVPQHPELWGDLCGWYPLSGPVSDARARMMFGAGAQVFVRRGELHLRCLSPVPVLYKGFRLIPCDPKDPLAFRLDLSRFGLGSAGRVFFSLADRATNLHFDLNPVTLQRRSATIGPRAWVGASGADPGFTGATMSSLAARQS
jgi:hypothetical protein